MCNKAERLKRAYSAGSWRSLEQPTHQNAATGFVDQRQIKAKCLVALIDQIQPRLPRYAAPTVDGIRFLGTGTAGQKALFVGVVM